ncbi:MAG: hypothetical protein MJ186_01440 [Clostridia bacterium]|nr:hypothetical protein [Clostridia bacterium]
MTENRKIEHLKTAIIVVLFITTILLLFLVWRTDSRASSFKLSSILGSRGQAVWIPGTDDFIEPDWVIYGYGDGTFTKDREVVPEIYAQAIGAIANASAGTSIAVSEITQEQYEELLRTYESIRICFPFGVPFGEFCDRNGIKKQAGFDQAQRMNEIFVTSAVDESFFIVDGDSCYRFMSDKDLMLAEQWMAAKPENADVLYSAGDILGVSNTTPIPLALLSTMPELKYTPETEAAGDAIRNQIAEAVFGENFEFVRRITDNFGTITYMYGFGQKTLTCSPDGTFVYRTDAASGVDPGFYSSLEKAIAFMANAGGWGDNNHSLEFRLADCSEEGSGRNKVYTFEFAQNAGGSRILGESGCAMTVQVCAGEVSSFVRSVVNTSAETSELRPAADAVNVIAGNCNLMYNVLQSSILSETKDEAFTYTCANLSRIYTGYIRTEDLLVPGWVITLKDGSEFYFNLYTAAPLGFTRK